MDTYKIKNFAANVCGTLPPNKLLAEQVAETLSRLAWPEWGGSARHIRENETPNYYYRESASVLTKGWRWWLSIPDHAECVVFHDTRNPVDVRIVPLKKFHPKLHAEIALLFAEFVMQRGAECSDAED